MESLDKIEKLDWDNMPSAKIHIKLTELKHRHESLKNKIDSLIEVMVEIESEYAKGEEIKNKRAKGIY
jgi:hypothetical protein